jgi:hypothetical protein
MSGYGERCQKSIVFLCEVFSLTLEKPAVKNGSCFVALFCFTVFYGETENPSFQEPEELGVIYGQGLGVPADIKKASFRQMDEKIKVKI